MEEGQELSPTHHVTRSSLNQHKEIVVHYELSNKSTYLRMILFTLVNDQRSQAKLISSHP